MVREVFFFSSSRSVTKASLQPFTWAHNLSQQTMLLLLKVVRSGELMFHYGQLGSMMRLTTKRKIKTTDLEIMVTVGI